MPETKGNEKMKNMSFFKTTDQIRAGTKTVTRRLGWRFLKRGDLLMAVVKCQGLRKGEKVQKIRPIKIIDINREPLWKIENEDVLKEGFLFHIDPNADRNQGTCFRNSFIDMFCELNKCNSGTIITRIEFKYINQSLFVGYWE